VATRSGDETDETDETQQVIEALTAAFIEGRLSKDEFDHRVGQALAAYAELKAIAADIPAAPTTVSPVPSAAEQSEVARQAYNRGLVARGTFVAAGAVMVAVFMLVTAISGNPFVGFIAGGALAAVMVVFLGAFSTFLLWALESSGGGGRRRGSGHRGNGPEGLGITSSCDTRDRSDRGSPPDPGLAEQLPRELRLMASPLRTYAPGA
jgi:hypothetical protein